MGEFDARVEVAVSKFWSLIQALQLTLRTKGKVAAYAVSLQNFVQSPWAAASFRSSRFSGLEATECVNTAIPLEGPLAEWLRKGSTADSHQHCERGKCWSGQ